MKIFYIVLLSVYSVVMTQLCVHSILPITYNIMKNCVLTVIYFKNKILTNLVKSITVGPKYVR